MVSKMIMIIFTSIAIAGAITVALGKPLAANILWILSNPCMAIHNYNIGEFEMAGMFFIYSIVALYGVYNLKFKHMLKKNKNGA